MALVYSDRVKETTTTTGTGAYILDGAVTGYQDFSVVGDTNTCHYCATDGTDWEVGIGTYTVLPDLARTTVIKSSNSDAEVDWGAGSKDIFIVHPSTLTDQNLKTTDVPTFDGLALTDDLTVTEASGAGYATLKGSTAAGIILQDTGGATGEQAFSIDVAGELVGFNTLTDSLAFETFSDVLSFDLATGFAGIGGVPATDQLKVYGAVRASNLIGSNFVDKSVDYTMAAGEHVIVTATAADITITLPTSPNAGDICVVSAWSISGGYQIIIDTGTVDLILLNEGAETTVKLFVTNETMALKYNNSLSRWFVLDDTRLPHTIKMYNTGQQTISTATWSRVNSSHSTGAVGFVGDTVNNRVNILRDGKYALSGAVRFNSGVSAGDVFYLNLYVNGGSWYPQIQIGQSTWDSGVNYPLSMHNVTAGQYLELFAYQATGGNHAMLAGSQYTVQEIR